MNWKDIVKYDKYDENDPRETLYGDKKCPVCGTKLIVSYPSTKDYFTGKDEDLYCPKCEITYKEE
jgi:hypothetical protein